MRKFRTEDLVIGYYTGLSAFLQVVDHLVPAPIPGVKFGLANIISLYVLNIYSFSVALKVAIFRPILAGFITGSISSPTVFISLFASVISLLIMGFAGILMGKFLSNISISSLGAATHNFAQILIVYLLFVHEKTIFVATPLLVFLGIIFGVITGYIVNYLVKNRPKDKNIKLTFIEDYLADNNKDICTTKEKHNFFIWCFMFFLMIFLLIFIKNIGILIVYLIVCLILKLFLKDNQTEVKEILKEGKRYKLMFFFFIISTVVFVNILTFFWGGRQFDKTFILKFVLPNIFISIIKVLIFIIVSQSLTSSKYIYKMLFRFPNVIIGLKFFDYLTKEIKSQKGKNIKDFLLSLVNQDLHR